MPKLNRVLIARLAPAISALAFLVTPAFADGEPNPFAPNPEANGVQAAPKLATSKDYFLRALKEDSSKDYVSATRDYSEAIRLNPTYGEAYGNRGADKFNLQDYDGALSDYNTTLKYFPSNQAVQALKAQAETAIKERAKQQAAQTEARRRAAILNQAILGGDLSDPATIIMMNAQRRGLVPQATSP